MNNKKNNKGCMSGVLGTLIVLAGVAGFAVLTTQLGRLFLSLRYGEEAVCAIFTFSMAAIGIAFLLYEIAFIMWQVKLSATASGDQENAARMAKAFKIILPVCIALSLLVSVFSANTYTMLREDSISQVCFAETEKYSWQDRNDVLRYTFSCDKTGGLTFNVTMKDGEVIELFGGVNSLTDSFREDYDTSNANLLAYAAHLTDEFKSSGYLIDKKVNGAEHMERLYKEARPEVWVYMEKIIENAK